MTYLVHIYKVGDRDVEFAAYYEKDKAMELINQNIEFWVPRGFELIHPTDRTWILVMKPKEVWVFSLIERDGRKI